MNDIFKDMQVKVGCEYISDLPYYKRKAADAGETAADTSADTSYDESAE